MTVVSGRKLFGHAGDPVYRVLGQVEPGLVLDVGASDGHKAEEVLRVSPKSELIAVEPFPPNVDLLSQRLGSDTRVTIVPKAVGDKSGEATFTVPSVVKVDGARAAGYSSVGFLSENPIAESELNITVKRVPLDHVIDGRRVRLLKIDVQGGEPAALRGAHFSFSEHRVDMAFVEFSGQSEVLQFFARRGYVLFDTKYLLVPKAGADLSDWDLINEKPFRLSTGLDAYNAWPKNMPSMADSYVEMFNKQRAKLGYLQTDLVAVSPHFLIEFLDASRCVFSSAERDQAISPVT